MSEQPEDYNAFNKWDAVGASAMLGLFPAVMHFIFSGHDIPGTLSWLVLPVVAAVAVYVCGFIVPGKLLGRVVNMSGLVLTPVFLVIALIRWADVIERDFSSRETAPSTQQPNEEQKKS